jgi:hypothetical protein
VKIDFHNDIGYPFKKAELQAAVVPKDATYNSAK